jgi:hypothetical protein
MSVIVSILNNGIDAIVWSSEELEGVVTAIDTRFWYYIQIVKQDTARFLMAFRVAAMSSVKKPTATPPWP